MPNELAGVTLYTLPEIADKLNLTVYTIRNYIKAGKLKAIKMGKSYRVEEAALKEFLLTGTQGGKPDRKIKKGYHKNEKGEK